MGTNYGRGLSAIPTEVKDDLHIGLLRALEEDGHGISFPDPSGCQVRVNRDYQHFSHFFSYKQHGGIMETIEAAMEHCKKLRAAYPRAIPAPRDHVIWYERFDRRKGKVEYCYRVFFKANGKMNNKSFSFGYRRPSPVKQLHGFLTARLFRYYYEELGEEIVDHIVIFQVWKEVCLYRPGRPYFDWRNS